MKPLLRLLAALLIGWLLLLFLIFVAVEKMSEDDFATEAIDHERKKLFGKGDGDLNQNVGRNYDPRFSKLLGWAYAAIGLLFLWGCQKVYDKLSDINDTLARAVVTIEIQRDQIKELKEQVKELQHGQQDLSNKVSSLEGKTLRGIAEAGRAR